PTTEIYTLSLHDALPILSPASSIGEVYPGDLKYADIDGDGFITEADRTIIGNPTPDFSYGISANVSYKGFDLSVDGMGVYGNEIDRKSTRLNSSHVKISY